MKSALYLGLVTHARLRPMRHRLRYRLAQGLFDLDELPMLDRTLRLFGHNRAAPISFHDKDHGDGSGDLRGWVEGQLRHAGLHGPWGAIQALCLPRMLGYVFNPLSVFFCHDQKGRLAALVYEVNNTFGERHAYAMPATEDDGAVRQSCDKAFYVSPFLPMGLAYRFKVAPPGGATAVEISARDEAGTVLEARFAGRRQDLDDRALARVLANFPLMTLKVVLGIHWEALKLWLKGARLQPRPSNRKAHRTLGAPRASAAEN